jgi:hypothetical protein
MLRRKKQRPTFGGFIRISAIINDINFSIKNGKLVKIAG